MFRTSRKIANFPIDIFWEPELMTAEELHDEMWAREEYKLEMRAERWFENGRHNNPHGMSDFYEMENEEKNLANWGPAPIF